MENWVILKNAVYLWNNIPINKIMAKINVIGRWLGVMVVGMTATGARAEVVINEVMQSNVYGIMDDLNDFPDSWVELYNTGSETVDVTGYGLGTKDKFKKAYKLPAATIAPGGYLLVYCDKVGEGLHADFRVDSGKGDVFLFDSDGNVLEQLSLKKQLSPDIAYGRKSDGADKWGYQLVASPGAANTSGVSDVLLPEVTFSEAGGVWSETHKITLELNVADAPEGTTIIYTTDGREPQPGKAPVYSSPITVSSSKVVRAKAICDGCLSRPSNAQSYIFYGREMKIPVISLAIDNDYLYDNKIGIFADGYGGHDNENYRHDWRRPLNIEMFDADGAASVINQIGETRVQGGYTRSNALKSMCVYANKRFGEKRLAYEFWAKDKPGVNEPKSIVLRDGGNDYMWAYYRDGLAQRAIGRNTEIDWQGYSPAVVYINGKYHGMLAIRERSNDDYVAANYDGLEDIDMFENWYELKVGDEVARDEFFDFINSGQPHTFDDWAQRMNMESYVNLMSLNYWIYNTDFPHNNTVMWRRTDGTDGRWQWLVKDCDFGFGAWNSNENVRKNFTDFLNNNTWDVQIPYVMFRELMKNDDFQKYFADHLIVYTGDFLTKDALNALLDEINEENYGEQRRSHDTWKNQSGAWWSNFDDNVGFIYGWISQRASVMPSLIKHSFKLGSTVDLVVNKTLDADEAASLHITYNGVKLTRGVFEGKEYQGRSVTLAGDPEDHIVAWDVRIGGDIQRVEGSSVTLPISELKRYQVDAVVDLNGISDIALEQGLSYSLADGIVTSPEPITVYDLSGRPVAPASTSVILPARGLYILTSGSLSAKIAW